MAMDGFQQEPHRSVITMMADCVSVVVAMDIVNAFNEIERKSVLKSIWEDEEL